MKIKNSELVVVFVLAPHFMNGFYDFYLSEFSLPIYSVLRLITSAMIPLIGIIILSKRCTYKTADFGLVVANKFINVWGVLLATLPLFLFWRFFPIFYYRRIDMWFINLVPVNYFKMPYPKSIAEFSLFLHLLLVLTAGFFEEVYYRSILYKIFKERKMNVVSIILISSLIFTAAHWEAGIHWLPLVFIAAIVLSWFYAKYRTAWPLIIAHILVDLFSIIQ